LVYIREIYYSTGGESSKLRGRIIAFTEATSILVA